MADQFDIESKLKITGVEVKGNLDAGTLKFKVDTSALKKLVSDAGEAAKKVKTKLNNIKLNKLKLEVNQNSLRGVESKIRRAVQNAVQKTKLDIQTNVAGGTKTDPFKAQRQAASKSAGSLQRMHELTKQVNSGLRSLVKTMGSLGQSGSVGKAKGNLPFPAGSRTVNVADIGAGGGGRVPPTARSGAGFGGFDAGGGGVDRLSRGIKEVTSSTEKANLKMKDLEDLTFEVGRKAAAFRGVAIAINTVVNAVQAAVKFVIDFNDSLIELNKILQTSDKTLQMVGNDLFGLSSKTGVAVDQTINIAQEFARAGLAGRGYGTVVELTDRALTGLQGTTLDAAQSSQLFVQIIQQVEANVRGLSKELVTTTKLFDVLGKAEDITASKATDVQQAFKRSAASIFATGATIEQATAVISVLQERTQRGGDVVGTALKTLASRISSSTSDATKALNAIGVQTIDTQGNLRNLFDVLQDTAVAFQTLTESEQADVAVKAAGIRQVEIFRAALQDFGRTQDVTNQLIEATGDATRKQRAEQSKLANVIARLQIAFQQLVRTTSEGVLGEMFIGALKGVEAVATSIAQLDRALGGAASTFTGFLAVGLAAKVLIPMFIGIKRAISFFIHSQDKAAVGMGKIDAQGKMVAQTVEGRMNTAMQRTAMLTAEANNQMKGLSASALFAAKQAERMAKARAAAYLGSAAGQEGVANRARGNMTSQGIDIIATGRAIQEPTKAVGRFGSVTNGASKALQFASRHITFVGLAASVAGGALQSLSNGLNKGGSTGLGAAADIGGGALGGAGTGALLGSFIPGVGTAIGAGVGALAGAIPGLVRTFSDAGNQTDELRRRYIELGIVQTENGEITSAVAQKLDESLRNLKSFKNFELKLEEGRLQDLFDPGGAQARKEKIQGSRQSAQQGLRASFDRSASAAEQNARIFQALSKTLEARTGEQLDLSASDLLLKSSPILNEIGETTLRELERETLSLAESFGTSTDQVRQIFDEEISRVRNKPLTADAIKKAEQTLSRDVEGFIEGLDVLIPAGGQIARAAEEQAGKFKEAVSAIALGQGGEEAQKIVRETLADVLTGKTILQGGSGENIVSSAGRGELQSLVDQASSFATKRQNVGTQGIGQATPEILKRIGELIRKDVGAEASAKAQDRIIKSQERVADAFSSIRLELPLDKFDRFLDEPVDKLQFALREFISEFGREVGKLNETRLKATTPQIELADALARHASETAKSLTRRADLEKSDALQKARVEFQTIAGPGERQFGNLDALRAKLGEGIIPQDAERRIKDSGRNMKDFLNGLDNIDLAELFEIDESDANKIRDAAVRTTGGALKDLFKTLFDTGRKLADEGVIDPDAQRAALQNARGGLDLTGVNDEQIKKVTDGVLGLLKTFTKLDTEALQATITSNKAMVDALKKRLTEEQKTIALDQRRREVTALNARAISEELTGIRRLVAEREIEARLADGVIAASQSRLSGLDAEIMKLNAIETTEQNRVGVLDQLKTLEDERVQESIKLEESLAKQRIASIRNTLSVAKEATNAAKVAAEFEKKRITGLAEISKLLSVDQSEMSKFNAELNTLGAEFRVSQAELAAEATVVNATITDQAEKEARLSDIKKRGAALALEQAQAEAQIIQKRREAIKQVSQELVGNAQEQVDAQRAVIEATAAVGDAFESYLQAVDGAIMATTRYNLGLSLAAVETTKITGGFSGLRQEIGAVQDTFRSAERLARDLGASEKTLVEIRRESINQQLTLFNNLLQEQSQLARNFFTSSTQDQADLFSGIQEAGAVADLLGGSFGEFKKLGESAINDLGAQLLALPQETRQRIVSSLETLRSVGGEVGGFTADQLLTAIETSSLGVSGEGLQVDPLFEIQERIAGLQEQQAQIATEQLIASQEQVIAAKEQLEQAQAQKDLAEIQLERVKEEGDKLRGKLGELQGQLNTTLLQQEQTQRQGFSAVTGAITRVGEAVVSRLPDAFSVRVAEAFREVMNSGGVPVSNAQVGSDARRTPESDGKILSDAQREAGRNRAQVQQMMGQAGPSVVNTAVASSSALPGAGGGNLSDLNNDTVRRLEDIVTQLKDLNTTSESNLAVTEAIRDSSGSTVGTATAVAGSDGTEITINVEGQTNVTVTGFEAGVARLATTLAESLGGFVSNDEARRIANEVLENIRTELLRRGIISPTTL